MLSSDLSKARKGAEAKDQQETIAKTAQEVSNVKLETDIIVKKRLTASSDVVEMDMNVIWHLLNSMKFPFDSFTII